MLTRCMAEGTVLVERAANVAAGRVQDLRELSGEKWVQELGKVRCQYCHRIGMIRGDLIM